MPKQQGKDHYGHSWKRFFPLLCMKEMWGQGILHSLQMRIRSPGNKPNLSSFIYPRKAQKKSLQDWEHHSQVTISQELKLPSFFTSCRLGGQGAEGCQSWEYSAIPSTAECLAQSLPHISFLERITNDTV